MIFTLIRDQKPLLFFTTCSLILLIIAALYFFPILIRFLSSGYVLKIPTLIVISTVVIIAALTFLTGVILHVLKKQHNANLEHHLTLIDLNKKNK